jgi:hypothetical protein
VRAITLSPQETTPLPSLEHQLTELSVLIDEFLRGRPALAYGRPSPHDSPAWADAAVLTRAGRPGCLGGASLQQTERLVAYNYRSAFPGLCSYQPWRARWPALTVPIRALLSITRPWPPGSPAFSRLDTQPRESGA